MKRIEKILMSLFLLAIIIVKSQVSEGINSIRIGINSGFAVHSSNVSSNIDIDVAYQHLVNPNFGLGLVVGYNHFFGEQNIINNTFVKNNDIGLIPVTKSIRYYLEKKDFICERI